MNPIRVFFKKMFRLLEENKIVDNFLIMCAK